MANYIMLNRYTDQGIRTVKQSPDRLQAIKQTFRQAGAEVKEAFLVMGRFDTVLVVEVPDDETFAKLCLGIGAAGNVRTESLRAFSEDEFRKVVAAL